MTRHAFDKSEKCTHDTTYELNHALVQLIQKCTGEHTHVIMNNIITETNKMLKELEVDPNSKTAGAKWGKSWHANSNEHWISSWNPKRKNKLVSYPNSDIKFNLVVTIQWHEELIETIYDKQTHRAKHVKKGQNINELKVKVTLPTKILKYSTGDMSMLLAEGDILDESTAIDELEIKQSKPPRKKKTKTDPIEDENGEEV